MINGREKGNIAERAVAAWLRENGFPYAMTSRAKLGHGGTKQLADVVRTGSMAIEVKNRRDLNIGQALAQAQQQTFGEVSMDGKPLVPVVFAKPYGVGNNNVGRWWAISYVDDYVRLILKANDDAET